ncbi:M6 family metalloprotease domain-containing protein, partial [Gallaecimonas xiamenensis]
IKKRIDGEAVEALADGTVSTQELRKIPLPPPPIIKKRFDSVEMQRSLASEPKVLDLPLLTVMVDFDDVATENDFSDLIWGQGKSLANYFNSMSGGQLRLVPAADNDGDGIVKVHLNRNHPSCGSDCSYGINGVLAQALVQADDYLDFSQYDLNGDGTLTPDELAVQFIFAGNEAATSGNPKQSIWGHTWTMPAVNLDGTRLESYSALGEKQWGHRATLGVLAHQLGHLLLGLPDLYQDDPDHAGDIGQWGLMGTGSWNMTPQDHFMGDTPAALSAWSKSYLGLLTPKALVESGNYDVATGEVQKIYLDPYLRGQQQGDYLLLDVRDRSGYDSALPDQGLLVTQVSQSGAETVSTVQLLADDAVLPGSQQQRNLRLATAQGLPSDVYLSAISDPASQMRFSLNLDGGLKGALLGHYYQGQHQEVSGSLQWQGQAPQATSRLEGIDLYAPKAGSYSLKVQGGSDSRALSWHLQPGWHRLMLDQPLSIRAGFDLQLAGPALAVEPGTQAPAGQVLAGQGEAAQLSLLLGQEAPQTTDNQQSDSQSGAGFGRWLLQVLGG